MAEIVATIFEHLLCIKNIILDTLCRGKTYPHEGEMERPNYLKFWI